MKMTKMLLLALTLGAFTLGGVATVQANQGATELNEGGKKKAKKAKPAKKAKKGKKAPAPADDEDEAPADEGDGEE